MVLDFAFQYYRQHLDQLAGHDELYRQAEGLCQGTKPQVDEYRLLYDKVGVLHGLGHRRQEHVDPRPGEWDSHEHPAKSYSCFENLFILPLSDPWIFCSLLKVFQLYLH